MSLIPIFVKLAGEPVLVVGAGALAQSKIDALVRAGAEVRVVAPSAKADIAHLADDGRVRWVQRPFQPSDVRQETLVFAATGIQTVDRAVAQECKAQHVLCNAVDDPPYCDFYTPAIVQRGDLQIAISTNGRSPALARQLRERLEEQFGPEWEERVDTVGRRRDEIRATVPPGDERARLLHAAASEAFAEESPQHGSVPRAPHAGLLQRALDGLAHWLQTEDERVALI